MARLRKLAIPVGAAAVLVAAVALAAPPPAGTTGTIELLIENAAPGAVIVPPPGRYVGHIILDKPVILDGQGKVTLDAGDNGTNVEIQSDHATLRGFHLINSGEDHNDEDAAVKVHGNHDSVVDNVIENCLEGINLAQSNDNIVRGNHISSKPDLPLGLKGDSIKLWYSNGNTISDNTIVNARDLVVWYSNHNVITGNSAHHGRYGLHFMYAGQNLVEYNDFNHNSVGISMMYSEGVVIRHNHIASAVGAAGTCVAAKESSSLTIEDNDIVYCSQGLYLDVAPYQPGETNTITGNRFSFNDIAVAFLSDWHDNVFKDNVFKGNITQVAVYGGGGATHNVWDGNTWDTYEGFDRNHDGIGDTPFKLMGYAGNLWMERPDTRFFKGTPLLEVIDFLDHLAPFSEPHLLLEDKHPRYRAIDPGQQKAPKTS